MMYFGRLKTTLILAVCVIGMLLCVPNVVPAPSGAPYWPRVRLGLDLQGGSYLLLEVDQSALVRERLEGLADSARQALISKVQFRPPTPDPAQGRVVVRIVNPAQVAQATQVLQALAIAGGEAEFEVAALPDNALALTPSAAMVQARAKQAVEQSIEIVRRRIDEAGTADPLIAKQGDNRIVVQLPGESNPQRIKDLLGRTARMTFQLVDEGANPAQPAPPGDDVLPSDNEREPKVVVRKRVEVDGATLTDARPGQDSAGNRGWVVNFTFDGAGASRFAAVTAANIGHRFAVVLDNKVITAPVINGVIPGGRGQISGNFTLQSASDLSVLLRAGALPAPLTVIEERSVGPELGADSIRAGALSLAVGFLLVIAYMGVFYGLFGWYANVALLMNLALQISILSLLQATLTLPGMAGILLTLGMAVDANILINERVREETKNGRTPLNALETGFRRAYSTIIDSNVTALLAHVALFLIGSGPVRGFAVTITVGIVTTLFTATLFARMLMVKWYVGVKPAALPV